MPTKTNGKHGTRTITEQDGANAHSQKEQNETQKIKRGNEKEKKNETETETETQDESRPRMEVIKVILTKYEPKIKINLQASRINDGDLYKI